MAIDRRCLHLPGVFRDGRFNGTIQNVVGSTLVATATKFGPKSPITRIVWQIDRICLHLTGGFQGRLIQWNHANVVGPTLVAMATIFALGAESNRLPACPSVRLSRSFKLILFFCFSMESSHFLAIISPCGTLQNVVLRFLI